MDLFTKCSVWLANNLKVGGINWVALANKGTPGVWQRAYINEYVAPAWVRAGSTMSTLGLNPGTTAEVLSDYYKLRDTLGKEVNSVLVAVGNAVEVSSSVFAPTVAWSAANNVLFYLWSVTTMGIQSHISGVILMAGLSDEEVAQHAELCVMSCNLLSQLDAVGALRFFKKGAAPTSGLGLAPVAAGVLIAIGVALAIALAWAAVAIYETSRINARIDAACNRALETGSAADQATCAQMAAAQNSLSSQIPKAATDLLEKVSIAAMVGAGLWMLVQFGPGIATKLKQSISAYKSS